MPDKSLFEQVRDTMLITVFVFLGIEGASVYSRFAKKRSDVGAATILGFVGVTAPDGRDHAAALCRAPRAEIAGVRQPSLAGALELSSGTGARCSSRRRAGLGARRLSGLVADLRGGALRRRPSRRTCRRCLPPRIRTKCRSGALADQHRRSLFVISTYWSRDAFNLMLNMTSVMALIPFFLVAAYGILDRAGEARPTRRRRTSAGAT